MSEQASFAWGKCDESGLVATKAPPGTVAWDSAHPGPVLSHPWYVLYVKPRHEKNVSAILRGKGYEEFLPLYGRRKTSRGAEVPLFPGYVFCRFDPLNRLPVLTVPGVFSIVTFAGKAAPVQESEIQALQRVILNGLPREPWPGLPPGRTVTVARGPIKGLQGVVLEHKACMRVIISVTLLQRAVAVEVEREWLIA